MSCTRSRTSPPAEVTSANPACRAASALRWPTANSGSLTSAARAGLPATAPGALALVTMTPPQVPERSVATGSTRSSGATNTACPRARKAAAVRSLSVCGRVTTRRMSFFPAHDLFRKPVSTFRDHALVKESGAGLRFEFASSFAAYHDRILTQARSGDIVRGGPIRPRDQPAEVNSFAGNIGMPADRRLAGAVEHTEERTLAGKRDRGVGVIDARQQFARARVVRARFDADRALPDRRQKFFRAHDLGRVLDQTEPLQSGERQDRRIDFTVREFAQPRLHVAAQRHHAQVAARALGDRLPPWRLG